ncbi:MAG TPA: EAL domain-containing protein [Rhodanobacteraceae bacterium]|nr:EAL domain-containing protein [Rhodanobacteraceae bacterium]
MAQILIVDDRAINREFLATLLGYVGHRVIEAVDGVDALACARREHPDLIVTDVLMPNMDGVELADRIHDDPSIAQTPIIFYTATYRVPEASVLAESCRVTAVIAKPAEPQVILDAVASALGSGPAPILMPQQAAAPPSFLGATLPAYLHDLSELQQRLRRVLDEAVEEDRRERPERHDTIVNSYQTLGLRMGALLELGLVLASERDPENLLTLFCSGAQDIMSCTSAMIAVLDGDERRIAARAARGIGHDGLKRLASIDPRGGLFGEVLADGKPRHFDSRDAIEAAGLGELVSEAHSALVVPTPLRSTAAVRGWLCFAGRVGRGAFDDEDAQFAMTLAAQFALAYGNVVMYDEIQRHAAKLEVEIVERRRAQNELAHRISHDQTTGRPRFVLIEEYLRVAIAEAALRGGRVLVYYFDIDLFHTVNETRGRTVGDHVLRTLAERLEELIGTHGRLAHVAGDEFAIVLEDQHAMFDALAFGEAARASTEKPVLDGKEKVYVTCSVGVSAYPDNGRGPLELVRQAEAAMMRAKREGRNSVRAFSNDQKERLQDRVSLGPQLRDAIGQGQLVLHYQPLVAGDWRVFGFEALLRWDSPGVGILPPGRFLRVAEEFGLILDIDQFVLDSACRQARAWLDAGAAAFSIAVNVSAVQMQRADFVGHVRATLARFDLPPQCIELELTENMTTENVERMITTMQALKAIGVRLSLDDFGTGYSSLNYLRHFPIDTLKIDRSFVNDIAIDAGAAKICRSVITIGHELGMRVLAEGVETAEQVDYLQRNGCDAYQGYWFGRPVPAEEAERLLRGRDRGERLGREASSAANP